MVGLMLSMECLSKFTKKSRVRGRWFSTQSRGQSVCTQVLFNESYKYIIYYMSIYFYMIYIHDMGWNVCCMYSRRSILNSLLAMRWYLERSDELISATRSSGKPTMANLLSDAEQCMEQLPVLLKGHLDLQVFFLCAMGVYHGTTWFVVILCKKDITNQKKRGSRSLCYPIIIYGVWSDHLDIF